MAVMNPNLILAGSQGIDVLGAMDRGNALAQTQLDRQRQNALYDFMAQRGGDLMRGDENALAALSAHDPRLAFDMHGQVQARAAAAEQTAYDRQRDARKDDRADQEFQLKVQKYAADLSAQERAAQAEQVENGVKMALTARSPDEWDAIVTQVGAPELVGQFENREALTNRYMSVAEIMKGQNPDGTTAMQNYQFLTDQGLDPEAAMDRAFSGGTNVSINNRTDPAPATGYRNVYDDAGNLVRQEPIEGGPAAQEAEEAKRREAGRQAATERSTRTVLRAVDRSLEYLPDIAQGDGVVGASTRIAKSKVPGTAEYNLNLQIQDFLSNVGIDQLNAMRANSPTGGALGNVTEKQQARLEQVLGSFDLAQPVHVIEENLNELNNIYMEITYGTEEERAQAVAEGRLDPDLNAEIQSMFRDSGYDQYGRPKASDASADDDLLRKYGLQ